MRDIIVKNYQDGAGTVQGEAGNQFAVNPIIPQSEVSRCAANFVELDPGNTAYGYHYHEVNEEVFYIISGVATMRTLTGELHLKAGDAIAFPANEAGSHVISNPSATEKLVYLDFGTAITPDVVHFTGTPAGMVIAQSGIYHISK